MIFDQPVKAWWVHVLRRHAQVELFNCDSMNYPPSVGADVTVYIAPDDGKHYAVK